jgi:two-component system, NtrC family, sensor kinase
VCLRTLLVADDDPDVLDVLAGILRHAGYRVLSARSGSDAIHILDHEPVDLLLTDVEMPGLNGWQLAAQAKTKRPHLRVVFITAGTRDRGRPPFPVIEKPVRAAELVDAIGRRMSAV